MLIFAMCVVLHLVEKDQLIVMKKIMKIMRGWYLYVKTAEMKIMNYELNIVIIVEVNWLKKVFTL
jgi:hypothetical protein